MADGSLGLCGPLLTEGCIRNILSWGRRISFDLARYLDNLVGEAVNSRTYPAYVCTAASIIVGKDAFKRGEKEEDVVIQAFGCGDVSMKPITDIIATMKTNILAMRASFPSDAMSEPVVRDITWMGATEEARAEAATIAHIHSIISVVSEHKEMRTLIIRILTTGLLAYSKQGQVTTRIITKISNAIHDELGLHVALNPDAIKMVWSYSKNWFNPERAAEFFQIWEKAMEGFCLTLKLTVQQAQWTGMTNYRNIARASKMFQDFPWARLHAISRDDFNNYQRAVTTVADNPYYGYNSDLGRARATFYPNLAYAACTLLRECGGEKNLTGFMGINRHPIEGPIIDEMIASYRSTRISIVNAPNPKS